MRNRSRSQSLAVIKKKKNEMIDEEDGEEVVRERIREASRSRSKGFRRQMS